MNYKFNESYLATSYIKELLTNFNLPKCEVWVSDDKCFEDKFYIKDGWIQKYIGSGFWKKIHQYVYGRRYLNITEKFSFKSLNYDIETHNYLGRYLRFIRDYWKLDLMQFYNCFSGEKPNQLNFSIEKCRFSKNSGDIYYLVPIKFNQKYTIALSSNKPIELACILYDNKLNNENIIDYSTDTKIKDKYISSELATLSYKKVNNPNFFNPFIFSTENILNDYNLKYTVASKSDSLKLILKLPSNFKSSIVVLEGDYRDGVSHLIGNFKESIRKIQNDGSVISYPAENTLKFTNNFKISSNIDINCGRLSLLQYNDNVSYPFADKLIEFLSGNVICQTDQCAQNIERVQNSINSSLLGYKGLWTNKIRSKIISLLLSQKSNSKVNSIINNTLDMSYYVDKDTESALNASSSYNIRYTED